MSLAVSGGQADFDARQVDVARLPSLPSGEDFALDLVAVLARTFIWMTPLSMSTTSPTSMSLTRAGVVDVDGALLLAVLAADGEGEDSPG